MIVVSDASPLAALSYIRKLNLLEQLYGQVLVPEAVWQELLAGQSHPGGDSVLKATWIERRAVQNRRS